MAHRHEAALWLVLATLPACGEDSRVAAATAIIEAYQEALFSADREALPGILTAASWRALRDVPLDRVQGQERLEVVRARRSDPQVLLDVESPGRARSTYVCVVTGGEMRLDLVASVAYNHVKVGGGGPPTFVPRPLSAAELARIRTEHGDKLR